MNRLETAVQLCTTIEQLVRPLKYHCALTGSTLYGMSAKPTPTADIDVLIYGHWNGQKREPVNDQLLFSTLKSSFPSIFFKNRGDYSDCIGFIHDGHSVDVFVVGELFDFVPTPIKAAPFPPVL